MKILILSNLHLEFASFTPPTAEVDVVILAGDIWKKDLGIYWARETWPDKKSSMLLATMNFMVVKETLS